MDSKLKNNQRPLNEMRPIIDKEEAARLATLLFGLRFSSDHSQVKEFVSYDDRNFYMKGTLASRIDENSHEDQQLANEEEFVLKILNNIDSENIPYVDAQNEIMLHLKARDFVCPVPIKSLDGTSTVAWKLKSPEYCDERESTKEEGLPGRVHAVRLLSFVPGKLLKDVQCTSNLLFNLGRYVARMHEVLQGFHHPGIGPLVKQEWDLSQLFVIERYIPLASHSETELDVLQQVYSNFVNRVIPQLSALKRHIIHGDLNDDNILVCLNGQDDRHDIGGILDFGDVSLSYRVFEVAICMMYMILLRVKQGDSHHEAIRVSGHVLCGYQSIYCLSQIELSLLYWSVAGRLFQSIVNGMYKQSLEPDNVYFSKVSKLGLKILSSYILASQEEVLNSWLMVADGKQEVES